MAHHPPALRSATTALFPGAFQPPHGAHLAAVRYLWQRPDVGRVVVIISNRNRGVPGTLLSLDARLSQRVWAIYLEDMPGVSTEIAPHTAVEHALGYVDHALPGDRLLLCIGQQDLDAGDDRFDDLAARGREKGVEVEVVAAPTAAIRVRATGLRESIARGEAGREAFVAGLPESLSDNQRERVWALCCGGLRPLAELARERLALRLEAAGIGVVAHCECVDEARVDPVFRLAMGDGRRLLARYAGDAEGADDAGAAAGHGIRRKPRRALKVERRALALLRAQAWPGIEVPGEWWFERRAGVLVLDELMPEGSTLEAAIADGGSVERAMAAVGRFLAGCHGLKPEPLRNSAQEDGEHALRRMADAASAGEGDAQRAAVVGLFGRSAAALRPGLMWLHASPGAVRFEGTRVGVVDFEHASSCGDPAFDLGVMLGDCLAAGARHGQRGARAAGAALLRAYCAEAAPDTGSLRRAAGWAAHRMGPAARSCAQAPAGPTLASSLAAVAADGQAADPAAVLADMLRRIEA